MKTDKIPAASFPKIPDSLLMRVIEEWSLPRKNQNLPRRSQDARKLAMRLRKTQAATQKDNGFLIGKSDTWQNISEFLNAAMMQNDFKTLEAFCEGVLEFSGIAEPVASGDAGLLQMIAPTSDPASVQRVEIARAILILQDRKGFPPYQSEIIEYLSDRARGDKIQNLSAEKLSKILKELELNKYLPNARVNP
jgi:hypothetical protein